MRKKPANEKFRRCQIFLAPDQLAFLAKRGKRLEVSQAYLVREAIEAICGGSGGEAGLRTRTSQCKQGTAGLSFSSNCAQSGRQ